MPRLAPWRDSPDPRSPDPGPAARSPGRYGAALLPEMSCINLVTLSDDKRCHEISIFRQRRPGHVHHHRKEPEIGHDRRQLDDALLAKATQHSRVTNVTNAFGCGQLVAEVVDLVLLQDRKFRSMPGGNIANDVVADPVLARDRFMHVPDIGLFPMTARNQDRE